MYKGFIKSCLMLIVVMAFFFWAAAANCAQVTLQWNSVAEADGYKVYYGPESGDYTSSQDVASQTDCSLSLDPGTYYFAVTAYNSYGESGYSDEISCKLAADLNPNCLSAKLKATSKLCSAYTKCYMKTMKGSVLNLEGCVSEAEEKFVSAWDKAESVSGAAGLNCSTAAATYIGDILFNGFGDLYLQISDQLDLEDKKATILGQSLLKAAGQWHRDILNAQSAYFKAMSADKLERAIEKADARFVKSWDKAVIKARKSGVLLSGLSIGGAQDIIGSNAVMSSIASEMGY
ncbi:exported hypothetical protein [uncultured Desulfobacterium sp.]|uniref:Fibronectin type-III domain-containing protein n=1 Tax=uncultured Desulfobacterium sp. TaxID=201089 RepID=A0A445MX73_9BACT|nr:exported hypothetical protein [uncultured Desulfobacterium sp.]